MANNRIVVPFKVVELQREYEYAIQVYSAVMYNAVYLKEECRYVADVSLNDILNFLGVSALSGKRGNLYGIAVATESLVDAGVFEDAPVYSTLNENGERVKYHYKRHFENKSHYVVNVKGDCRNALVSSTDIELLKSYDGKESVSYTKLLTVLCIMRSYLHPEKCKEQSGEGTEYGFVGRFSFEKAVEFTGYSKRTIERAIRVLKDLEIIKTRTAYYKSDREFSAILFFTNCYKKSDEYLKCAESRYYKMFIEDI